MRAASRAVRCSRTVLDASSAFGQQNRLAQEAWNVVWDRRGRALKSWQDQAALDYDPTQLRDPARTSTGGQWASKGVSHLVHNPFLRVHSSDSWREGRLSLDGRIRASARHIHRAG